ncbi:MAG: trypsin-like peptidase domain-containing protein [Rubrobacteraceae bacterium]|nr:trypsin-like peptidase domain-containing protein [Rubrobacteraceae bacterium]MBA3615240.1 trypsin-like peptidase domain-containing protein [Rubrobacteraceae bacterium]MDQ3250756.1 S1C family serine protease [Actinomycetota bacterium]MDQ3435945.1 S1C family serine protease [Actinomycetota bacterium]
MAEVSGESSAALAGVTMIEDAQRSVVQVRSKGRGIGAGVIWPGDGLVLTNHHVISGRRRRSNVRVALHDGRTLDADVVKSDRSLDLALLTLEGDHENLPSAPIGDSDALRVGELVYAIGHPWGSVGAVSAGIVGGVGQLRGPDRGSSTRYVRSDVALAPGNSGGPLLNARGEVVAINAMIFGSMALSIPSNAAEAWIAGERRPRLGIGVLPVEVPVSLQREAGTAGLVIAGVETGGAADRAGLLVGDVLLAVAGEPLGEAGTLLEVLARADDSVPLRVMRGGKIRVMEVRLKESGRAA